MVAHVGLAPTYNGFKGHPITILAVGDKMAGVRGYAPLQTDRQSARLLLHHTPEESIIRSKEKLTLK